MNTFKEFLGKIPKKKKKEKPLKVAHTKSGIVKDVGLWEPWLKKHEKELIGRIIDGPEKIKLPIKKGETE